MLAALLGWGGCVDYSPTPLPQSSDPGPGVDDDTHVDTGDTSPTEELCDGYDNNANGLVDEGFNDADGDGLADCIDSACTVESASSVALTDTTTCSVELTPSETPWDVVLLWEQTAPRGGCVVGSVADLDGDGVQEIACASEWLYILNGATGEIEWTTNLFAENSPATAADLDSDGTIELLGIGQDGSMVAIDGAGNELWRSSEMVGSTYGDGTSWVRILIEVVDVNADGTPEVLTHHAILSGADGTLVSWLDTWDDDPRNALPREIVVVDANHDGEMDFLQDWRAFDSNGDLLWEIPLEGIRYRSVTPLAIQANTDNQAEIVWVSTDNLTIVDPDGVQLFQFDDGSDDESWPRPCAADLDGDGISEIVSSIADGLMAWKPDGTLLWAVSTDDWSSGAGCSTFDFDLDGLPEVLYSDEDSFTIRSGISGEILFNDSTWSSNTVYEFPVTVDLDGDGSVEIVVPNGGGHTYGPAIRAYGHRNQEWPPGMKIWGSPTWSGTQLYPDGTVPRTAGKAWLETGIYRGQVSHVVDVVDVSAHVVVHCVSSCWTADQEVRVTVRLANLGLREVEEEAVMAVYGINEDGGRSLLVVLSADDFDGWVDNATATATVEVLTTVEQAGRGLVFVAGDDGSGTLVLDDCDASNNEITWRMDDCDGVATGG